MADFSLGARYSERRASEYTMEGLAAYLWQSEIFNKEDPADVDDDAAIEDVAKAEEVFQRRFMRKIRTASENCRDFLMRHGHEKTDFFASFSQNGETISVSPFPSERIRDRGSDKGRVFAYLQLLAYIMEKVATHSLTYKKLFEVLENPQWEYISLYDEILDDWGKTECGRQLPKETVLQYAATISDYADLISTIAQAQHNDYDVESEAKSDYAHLALNMMCFAASVNMDAKYGILGEKDRGRECFQPTFYRLVCYARACAWNADLLRAFEEVKEGLTDKKHAAEPYDKMLRNEFSKIVEEDQVSLALQDGEIVEIMSDRADLLLNAPGDNNSYLAALDEYIEKNIEKLTGKVFCTDTPNDDELETIRGYIPRFHVYWAFEKERYQNHCFLSKAKLISVFQAICLSMPKAGFAAQKGEIKTRDNYRESASYSSAFADDPERLYKNSYRQQVMCIWIDYLNLLHIASSQYAQCFLDVNIMALTAILHKGEMLTLSVLQQRTEYVFRDTVGTLICDANEERERKIFGTRLARLTGATVFFTSQFRDHATQYCFGRYCRLFDAERVAEAIFDSMKNRENTTSMLLNIAPGYMPRSELPPFYLKITWDRDVKDIILEDFIADPMKWIGRF